MEQNFWLCALANQTPIKTEAYEIFTKPFTETSEAHNPFFALGSQFSIKGFQDSDEFLIQHWIKNKAKEQRPGYQNRDIEYSCRFSFFFLAFPPRCVIPGGFFFFANLCISHTSFAIPAQNSSPSFSLSFRNQIILLREFFPLIRGRFVRTDCHSGRVVLEVAYRAYGSPEVAHL